MTWQQARELYDKFHRRSHIDKINDSIAAAATAGEPQYETHSLPMDQLVYIMKHYQSLGFQVQKSRGLAGYREEAEYKLVISWAA